MVGYALRALALRAASNGRRRALQPICSERLRRRPQRAKHDHPEADSYRGPGGLTARQIFSAVRSSEARDRRAGPAAAAAAPADRRPKKALEEMDGRELVALLHSRGVSFTDCLEKVGRR